jgi:hypothetical protein
MFLAGAFRCIGIAFAALVAVAAPAQAAWNQPVGGASPINQADNRGAQDPSLAAIGGIPYVAWTEFDGVNGELRVSRLNAAGTAWEQVVGGPSPINQANNRFAYDASLTGIGGVPYVAWTEFDGVNREIRVSRLNAAGTAWEQIVGGASPINQANTATADASAPSLTSIGGVPYVAWQEFDGSVNYEIRVSRLNAAGTAWEQPWTGVTASSGGINQASDRSAGQPSLTSIGGVPYVAWSEADGTNNEIRVSRLNAAGTAWEQVVGGPSPINQASNQNANAPSLTAIGGVPYVAWTEANPAGIQIRVSHLNAAGSAWEQVVGGPSPINQASNQSANAPSLTAIGGVPYVAWNETDGANSEARVSRLNAAGSAWEQVVGGASPINQASNQDASGASLNAIGGVPYVATHEFDGTNNEIRVSRLEPELTAPEALATDDGAVLLARVQSYGLRYPVAFDYGSGGVFGTRTAATPSSGDPDTVMRMIGGLTPATEYSYRAIVVDGNYAYAASATAQFTTDAVNGPGATGPAGPGGPPGPAGPAGTNGLRGDQGEPALKLLAAVVNPKLRARTGKRVSVDYLSTAPGSAALEVFKGKTRVARVTGSAKLGRNKIAWNGKRGRKKAKPGRYTLRLSVTGGDGQAASDAATVTVTR